MSENQVKSVYLGIGSNLGDKKKNIENSKFKLIEYGIKILQSSNFYETLSWPNSKYPKYLNIILKVRTNYHQLKLLEICKKIEKSLGRKKAPKNSPRECDIDIIDYANKLTNKGINLPHPEMHKRNFVIFPLFEIDKNWVHPISGQNIKKIIFSLSNKDIRSIKLI
jgi:2-amino-4-hydroxy-6-hydroxymethyldihydropteridine diphosphokinase